MPEYVKEPCYTGCLFNENYICKALTRCGQWSTSMGEAKVVLEEERGIVDEAGSNPASWPLK